jgi:hypothetical protein
VVEPPHQARLPSRIASQRPRTWFTPKHRAELWERRKRCQCVADIARVLERRNKSDVYRVFALNGGIVPLPRRKAPLSLRLTAAVFPERNGPLWKLSGAYLDKIALRLNQRPRKTLGWCCSDRLNSPPTFLNCVATVQHRQGSAAAHGGRYRGRSPAKAAATVAILAGENLAAKAATL